MTGMRTSIKITSGFVLTACSSASCPLATFDSGKELGAASILLLAGIQMGLVLVALRRWRLPVGTLTLVFTVNVALMGVFKDNYPLIPVATVAGLIADFLLGCSHP